MIIPPFYSTPTEDEIINHFQMISREIDLPIMVYNNPATSNIDILPETFAELSKIKNVKYCKESTMDVTRVKDIVRLTKGKIKVFGGIMGYESYLNGADGWVSVPSNILPSECTKIYENIKIKKNYSAAKKIYDQITPVIKAVGGHYYVAATKYFLNLMGFDVGKPLLPRLDLNIKKKQELQKIFRSLKLKKTQYKMFIEDKNLDVNSKKIKFSFENKEYEAYSGETVASALIRNGVKKFKKR